VFEEQLPLKKVTAFITRGSAEATEFVVFDHGTAGTQVPAGTVEEGEDFEEAALREAREESGLDRLRLVGLLGEEEEDLGEDRPVALETVHVRARPVVDEWPTVWSVRRGFRVRIVDREGAFVRIVYEDAGPGFVLGRVEGWVPASAFTSRELRRFYHFVPETETADRWHIVDEGHHLDVRWLSLAEGGQLVERQRRWLERYGARLGHGADSR
jgi:8-oxo-dGTP pyrophosphatase MutT (NUDIX family)